MTNALLSSKIAIVEEEPTVRPIAGAQTAVTGMVGITERGPFGPNLVTSFEEYAKVYGGYTANADVALHAKGFFENGGQNLWVSRVVMYTDNTDPDSRTSAPASVGIDATGITTDTLRIDAKSDGTYGNTLSIQIAAATSGDSYQFNLLVLKGGRTIEIFPSVTMDPTKPNYVETVVNAGSNLITAVDLEAVLTPPADRPKLGTYVMIGGDDGLVDIDDSDFIGSSVGGTGIRAFDTVTDIRLLAVPERATAAVHNAMVTYCDATRFGSVFAVLDPPANLSATAINAYVVTTALLKESSEFGAIYWPRVKISNPSKAVFGTADRIPVATSGMACGLYARNDAAQPGGVYEAPAGVDFGRLIGALELETDEVKDEGKRDLVFPNLINPVVGLDGVPIHIDGARTLKSTGPFPTIGERRGVIFIEQSIKAGLLFGKHRKIKPSLLARLARSVRTFLVTQMRNGAFASDVPATAFSLDFSPGLNPPSEGFARRTNGRIGLATAKPNEFTILRVGQDTRALEEELAAA